ncbi:MAG: hypothetical protein CMA29_02510 [Euryarchaeota archaeon]|nr:hypothetical protein [Euryarchaeota archaeon]
MPRERVGLSSYKGTLVMFLFAILLIATDFSRRYIHKIIYPKPHYNLLKDKDKVPTSCDDYIYGCCEIYDDCVIDTNHSLINPTSINVDWNYEVKIDPRGSNCPRLTNIIDEFNFMTTKNMTRKQIFQLVGDCDAPMITQCCSINYSCDMRYYWDVIYFNRGIDLTYWHTLIENNVDTIYLYNEEFYTHDVWCPSVEYILNYYTSELLKEKNDITVPLIFICILLLLDLIYISYSIYLIYHKCFTKMTDSTNTEKVAITSSV